RTRTGGAPGPGAVVAATSTRAGSPEGTLPLQYAGVDLLYLLRRPVPRVLPTDLLARRMAERTGELRMVQQVQDPVGQRRGLGALGDPAGLVVAEMRRGARERHDRAPGGHVVRELLEDPVALHARVHRHIRSAQFRRQF